MAELDSPINAGGRIARPTRFLVIGLLCHALFVTAANADGGSTEKWTATDAAATGTAATSKPSLTQRWFGRVRSIWKRPQADPAPPESVASSATSESPAIRQTAAAPPGAGDTLAAVKQAANNEFDTLAVPCSHCAACRASNCGCPNCQCCEGCCRCAEKYCFPVCEPKDVKSHCWCVKCQDVCIPAIRFPWESCCDPPRCGKVRTVHVLEKVECEHSETGYKWIITCRPTGCGTVAGECAEKVDCGD